MLSRLVPVLYIQIAPDRITVRNPKSGLTVSEVPEMAISAAPKETILAIGPQARGVAAAHAAQLVNPFAHPRSLVSDFTVAEQLLKHYVRQVQGRSLLAISPVIVIHPLGDPEGGFTQVERRAFSEMARGAGASQVVVWTGRPLTDQEVLSRQFPEGEGQWE
jgi:rod shape-determining protein MreB